VGVTDWPRVTAILASCGLGPDLAMVSPETLALAADRGSRVHALIEADHYGYLDEAEITSDVAAYFSAYRKFLAESGHEPIASEIEVRHPDWRFRGHVDRVGWLAARRALIDWKCVASVDERAAALQLAGYRCAWQAMHPTEPTEITAVVQLRADGTYRFHEVDAREQEHVFLAAVTVYNARKDLGR
jgi:hypothetical protein